jgi:hypothetical protein
LILGWILDLPRDATILPEPRTDNISSPRDPDKAPAANATDAERTTADATGHPAPTRDRPHGEPGRPQADAATPPHPGQCQPHRTVTPADDVSGQVDASDPADDGVAGDDRRGVVALPSGSIVGW